MGNTSGRHQEMILTVPTSTSQVHFIIPVLTSVMLTNPPTVMAIVTYILLAGLHAGSHGSFRPQILGEMASRATLVVLFDFLFVKLGCYILNIQGNNQFVDILAYTGYKFVGVIGCILAGFLGISGWLWRIGFIYVFLANAFFLVSTLSNADCSP